MDETTPEEQDREGWRKISKEIFLMKLTDGTEVGMVFTPPLFSEPEELPVPPSELSRPDENPQKKKTRKPAPRPAEKKQVHNTVFAASPPEPVLPATEEQRSSEPLFKTTFHGSQRFVVRDRKDERRKIIR